MRLQRRVQRAVRFAFIGTILIGSKILLRLAETLLNRAQNRAKLLHFAYARGGGGMDHQQPGGAQVVGAVGERHANLDFLRRLIQRPVALL